MNDAEMEAENELVAEVLRLARTVQAGLRAGDPPTLWKKRREQIAVLRQRIRTMRARHLGSSYTSSSTQR
jgi:hypothetical protein